LAVLPSCGDFTILADVVFSLVIFLLYFVLGLVAMVVIEAGTICTLVCIVFIRAWIATVATNYEIRSYITNVSAVKLPTGNEVRTTPLTLWMSEGEQCPTHTQAQCVTG
jgi:hypothetical protein